MNAMMELGINILIFLGGLELGVILGWMVIVMILKRRQKDLTETGIED
jgi:hypothetical protein